MRLFLFLHYAIHYILHSDKLNKYYTGACIDLESRFYKHNIGHSKFTSTGIPWKIAYKKEFYNLLVTDGVLQNAKKRQFFLHKIVLRLFLTNPKFS